MEWRGAADDGSSLGGGVMVPHQVAGLETPRAESKCGSGGGATTSDSGAAPLLAKTQRSSAQQKKRRRRGRRRRGGGKGQPDAIPGAGETRTSGQPESWTNATRLQDQQARNTSGGSDVARSTPTAVGCHDDSCEDGAGEEAIGSPLSTEADSGGGSTPDVKSFLDPLPGSCLLYTSPSPRDQRGSRMPSSA